MSSGNYESKILDAIQRIVDNAVSKANYDKTIKGIISKCADEETGKYVVKYQDSSLYAYATDLNTSYSAGEMVYVLIPGNDMTQMKTIIGSVDKLGTNYLNVIDSTTEYEVIGNNITSDGATAISLCSYTPNGDALVLYDKTNPSEALINIDATAATTYLKQSKYLICGASFQTALDDVQRYKGDYGIAFDLDFLDNNTGETVVRTYLVNVNQMKGNPYNYLTPSEQLVAFDIDGENFQRINKISVYCYDFPNEDGNITTKDIFISGVTLEAAEHLKEEELQGNYLKLTTPQGIYFNNNDADTSSRIITAKVSIDNTIINANSNRLEYYWFKENNQISTQSTLYNRHGGLGWECLNDYTEITEDETTYIDWKNATENLVIQKSNNPAKENTYKCVVIYNNSIVLSKEITIFNYSSVFDITITSDSGTYFSYDVGNPTLTCYVNGSVPEDTQSVTWTYSWAVRDNNNNFKLLEETTTANNTYNTAVSDYEELKEGLENGTILLTEERQEELNSLINTINSFDTITRIENNNIYKLKVNTITNFSTYTCFVYRNNNFVGKASITITNDLNAANNAYHLIVNNGNQVFKYNENGIAPTNKSLDKVQELYPLSFALYDDMGKEISANAIKLQDIEWTVPTSNTLLSISSTHGNPSSVDTINETATYKNYRELYFNIANIYNANKDRNTIELKIKYKDRVVVAKTDLIFMKEGQAGTNGTDFVCRIIPNTNDIQVPKYPTLIYNKNAAVSDTNPTLNYTPGGSGLWFKAELWHDGIKIFDGITTGNSSENKQVKVEWEILKNKYNINVSNVDDHVDVSNLIVNKTTGVFDFNNLSAISNTTLKANPANIVRCKLTYDEMDYYATIPVTLVTVNNSASIQYRAELVETSGFRYAMYTTDGAKPIYDSANPFALRIYQTQNNVEEDITENILSDYIVNYNWSVKGLTYGNQWNTEQNLIQKTIASETLKRNEKRYIPVDKFNGLSVNNALYCAITRNNTELMNIHIPIHLYLNKYGNAAINGWDGNHIEINEKGGFILAPQIGAGKKNQDNSFTGVFMGSVKEAGQTKEEYGLYGYNAGERTIALNAEDGSARFGKSGMGQIVLDPTDNTATLKSGNYVAPVLDQYGNIITPGQGLEIDLTDPHITFGSGKFRVDSDGQVYAQGFATIADLNAGNIDIPGVDNFQLEYATDTVQIETDSNLDPIESTVTKTITVKGLYKKQYTNNYTVNLIDSNGNVITHNGSTDGIGITISKTAASNTTTITFTAQKNREISYATNSYLFRFIYNNVDVIDKYFNANLVIQGKDGEQGATGPAGPAGRDGTSVTVKGSYANITALTTAAASGTITPVAGDGYIIGNDLYVFTNGAGQGGSDPDDWTDVGQFKGDDAKNCVVTASSQVFKSTNGGISYTPDNIILNKYLWAVNFDKWEYSSNGGNSWSTVPTGTGPNDIKIDSTSKALTIPKTCLLFTSNISTLTFKCKTLDNDVYDTMTIARVTDGVDGEDGSDGESAYNVILTNEAQTIAGDNTKALATTITTGVIGYLGSTKKNTSIGTITIKDASGQTIPSTAISASVSDNNTQNTTITFTVTNQLSVKNGQATIPVTIDNTTINKIFTFSLALKGSDGKGITTVTNYYATSNNGSTAPTGSAWKTDISQLTPLSASNKYLWNYESVSYTSGDPVETDPAVIGVYGDTGLSSTDGMPNTPPIRRWTFDRVDTGLNNTTYYQENNNSNYNFINAIDNTTIVSQYGKAVFDGTQTIRTDSTNLNFNNSFSISFWLNPQNVNTTQTLLQNRKSQGNGLSIFLMNKQIRFDVGGSQNTFTKTFEANTNYHIVLTYNSLTGQKKLYVNGAFEQTATITHTDQQFTNYLWSGMSSTNGTSFGGNVFKGTLDDLRIYDYVLNLDNIDYLYRSNGQEAANGSVGRGLSEVVEYYLATDKNSGITIGSTGWTTTIQTVTSTNKYLWNYEKLNYTDGSWSETNPVIIGTYGDKGDKGDKGDAGENAINVILTNEAQVIAGDTSKAIPADYTTNVNGFIGTTPATVSIGTPITGLPTGMSVKSITNNPGTNPTITFSVTDKMTTESGQVIIPVIISGTTINKVFSYSLSLKGESGDAAPLVDISATTQIFKSTDGGITFSPNTITLMPRFQVVSYGKWQYSTNGGINENSWHDVTSGQNGLTINGSNLVIDKNCALFTSSITSIVFKCISNNSSVFDTITVVRVYDVTNIEIGGRNYYKNSKEIPYSSAYSLDKWTYNNTVYSNVEDENGHYLQIDTSTSYNAIVQKLPYDIVKDKTVTISYDYQSSVSTRLDAFHSFQLSNTITGGRTVYKDISIDFSATNKWVRKSYTIDINDALFTSGTRSGSEQYFTAAFYCRTNGTDGRQHTTFKLRNFKLEIGNKATDWTPAPEDAEVGISNAQNSANAAQASADKAQQDIDNLIIGGRNVLQKPHIKSYISLAEGESIDTSKYVTEGTVTYTRPATSNRGFYVDDYRVLKGNSEYILHFYAKQLSGSITSLYMYHGINSTNGEIYMDGSKIGVEESDISIDMSDEQYHYFEFLFKTPATPAKISSYIGHILQFNKNNSNEFSVELKELKLENGNRATDWTPAPEDTTTYIDNLVSDLQTQVDGKIESYNQTNDPSSNWTTTTMKTNHTGDLWYNPNTKTTKRWSGTEWIKIESDEAQEAASLAAKKAQIFTGVTPPNPPYYIGDMWITALDQTGVAKTCKTSRTSGSYVASDWVEGLKYTDDTTADIANDKIDSLEIGGRNYLLNSNFVKEVPPLTTSNNKYKMRARGGIYTASVDSTVKHNGYNTYKIIGSEVGAANKDIIWDPVNYSIAQGAIENKIAYFSFWAKAEEGCNLKARTGYSSTLERKTAAITTDWNKFSIAVTGSSETNLKASSSEVLQSIFYIDKATTLWLSEVKLELSSKPTDWSPAPEDYITELEDYAAVITADLTDIQSQIDSQVITWFYSGVPTLNNAPASSWTTNELKDKHIGDYYYNTDNGNAYKFTKSGSTYSWTQVSTAVATALSAAATAQDTADHKRRVFYSTPTVPYDKGDLWVQGSAGDIKLCNVAKTSSQSYAASDWILASKYTDDTVANQAKTLAQTVQTDLNNLEIGGRNLLLESNIPNRKKSSTSYPCALYDLSKDSNNSTYIKAGQKYTVTVVGNFTNAKTIALYFGGGNYGTSWINIPGDGDQVLTWTFTATANMAAQSNAQVYVRDVNDGRPGTSVSVIKTIKLERGNRASDWTPAPEDTTSYVDNLVDDLQTQVDGKIQTYSQDTDPSANWDATEKTKHIGDLWCNTSTSSKITKRWSGSAWTDIGTADAKAASELASKKAQIFTGTPTIPYYVGDLWITGTGKSGIVKTCRTERTSGSYNSNDWTEDLKYTDDTAVENLKIGGTNLVSNLASNWQNGNWKIVSVGEPTEIETYNNRVSLKEPLPVTPGTEYWIKRYSSKSVNVLFRLLDANHNFVTTNSGLSDQKWTCPNNCYYACITIYDNSTIDDIAYGVTKLKIEEGNKSTGWSLSPEDVNNTEVGGRNLLIGASKFTSNSPWVVTTTKKDGYVYNDNIYTNFQVKAGEEYVVQAKTDGIWSPTHVTTGQSSDLVTLWMVANDTPRGHSTNMVQTRFLANTSNYLGNGKWKWIVPSNFNNKYLVVRVNNYNEDGTTSVTHNFWDFKLERGSKATDWTPAPEDINQELESLNNKISDYIVGTQTTTTRFWTGVSSLDTIADGSQIQYWLPYKTVAEDAGNRVTGVDMRVDSSTTKTAGTQISTFEAATVSNDWLNLTLADGSTTGWIPCYYGGTSRLTTHYGAGNSIRLTYKVNANIAGVTYTGWFADANYNTNDNTYDRIRFNNSIKAKTAITASTFIVADSGGYFKLVAGSVFDLDKPVLWAASAINANATGTNNYLSMPTCTVRNNTNSSWTATQYETLYLVGTMNGNKFTADSTTPFTTTKPTTEDGKIYMQFGYMYSTYQCYLYPEHPLFKYVNGKFKSLDQVAYEAQSDIDNLEVGGRNYLSGYIDANGTSSITKTKWTLNGYEVDQTAPSGYRMSYSLTDNANNAGVYIGSIRTNYLSKLGIVDGDQITVSFYIKSDSATINQKNTGYLECLVNKKDIETPVISTEWQRCSWTGIYSSTTQYQALYIIQSQKWTSMAVGEHIYISSIKIEKGTKPTDWTRSQEDVSNAIGQAVKSITELYYLHTSSSTAPTAPTEHVTSTSTSAGVWTTKCPTWASGKYYWTCSEILYASGAYAWTTPLVVNGLNSANTTANTANNKIDNLKVGGTNLLSLLKKLTPKTTNGITISAPDDNGWFTVSGSRTGTALFTIDLWSSSSNGLPTTLNIPYTMSVETQGTPFVSGTSYTNTSHIVIYYNNNSRIGGHQPNSVTFTPTGAMTRLAYYVGVDVPVGTEVNGKFRIKLEEGNTPTSWSSSTGDEISSIDTQYYLSTSNDQVTGGEWSTTAPTWSSGKYLWTRNEITWKNNSKTWTNAVLEKVINDANVSANNANNKIDNLKVGGRNLVLGTAIAKTETGSGGTNKTGNLYKFSQYYLDNYYPLTATAGESLQVTISYDWISTATSGTFKTQLNGYPYAGTNTITLSESNTSGHESQTITITKSSSQNTNYSWIQRRFDDLTGTVTFSNFKIEVGNKATDWDEAPEDTAAYTDEAYAQLGGRNLLADSNKETAYPSQYRVNAYDLTDYGKPSDYDESEVWNLLEVGEIYTITVNFTNTAERKGIACYVGGGDYIINNWQSISAAGTHTYSWTFTATQNMHDASPFINVYCSTTGSGQGSAAIAGTCYINWIKLEKGNRSSVWSLAPEDMALKDAAIKTVDIYYAVNNDANNAPGYNDSSWSTEVSSSIAKGSYLWSYVLTTMASGKIERSTPICLTSKPQILNGVVTQYAIHTSNTTSPAQNSSAWTSTRPSWTGQTDKYLWVRTKYSYINPTEIQYSTPAFDASWSDMFNINKSIQDTNKEIMDYLQDGFVRIEQGAIYIMDKASYSESTKAILLDQAGISFQSRPSKSANWTSKTAWNIDGKFDASVIEVINLTADQIQNGILKLGNENSGGTFELYNTSKKVIVKADSSGLVVNLANGGKIELSAANGFRVLDSKGNISYGRENNNNNTEVLFAKNEKVTESLIIGNVKIVPIGGNGIGFVSAN